MTKKTLQAYARTILPNDQITRGCQVVVWQSVDCMGNAVTYVDSGPIRICSGSIADCFAYLKSIRHS